MENRIIGEPEPLDPEDDREGWRIRWELADGEQGSTDVWISGSALAVLGGPGKDELPEETRETYETQGRAHVEKALRRGERPPSEMLFTTRGRAQTPS